MLPRLCAESLCIRRWLNDNQQLSGSIPVGLSSLTQLTYLCVRRSEMSGCGTDGGASRIRRSLEANHLSGSIPASLSSLVQMKYMCVHDRELFVIAS